MAKRGMYKGYLLEGMGCPGGCVGGAGTITAPDKTTKLVQAEIKNKSGQTPIDNRYMFMLDNVEERKRLLDSDFSTGADEWEKTTFND